MTVSMKKQIKTRWYVAALIAGMVVMCAIGFGIAMLGRNYMPRWLPVTIALLVTGPTVAAISPRLAKAAGIRIWAAAAIYAVVTGSIIFALVPGLNNFCTTAPAVVEATVASKYTRQHTRYRRVSRRVRVPRRHLHQLACDLRTARRTPLRGVGRQRHLPPPAPRRPTPRHRRPRPVRLPRRHLQHPAGARLAASGLNPRP